MNEWVQSSLPGSRPEPQQGCPAPLAQGLDWIHFFLRQRWVQPRGTFGSPTGREWEPWSSPMWAGMGPLACWLAECAPPPTTPELLGAKGAPGSQPVAEMVRPSGWRGGW